MRLSLRLKLFLVLLVAVGTVVGATWLFMQRAVEQGFIRLVETRQREQVDAVLERLETEYRESGGWQRLRGDRRRWVGLLLDARGGQRTPRWARGLFRHDGDDWPPRRRGRHGDEDERGERDGEDRRGAAHREPLMLRMMLLDASGRVIFGRQEQVDELQLTAVRVDGREVGYLGVLPGPALNQLADIRFVEEQKRAFLLIAAVTVFLAAAAAFVLAGAMTRRLREMARGARALATGHYDTRVAVGASDELGRLALAFNDLGAALEQAEKSRRQWVVDISHELRTPLATLRAELEALQDGVRALDAAAVDTLHADVGRLERLVDDLYDLARSDLGALSYHKRDVQPVAILEADLRALSGEFAQRQIRVEREGLAAVAVRVHADPDRLSQLFRNLLTNTLRYTDPGGVLRVAARRTSQGLVMTFDDSAPGVPASDLEHLFERFHRVERSRNRALGGAGLGLAICRNIVTAHGGTIDARHSELGGLHVRLTLPEAP